MSLFSFLRKNKQDSASGDSAFYSRAEEESKTARSRGKRRQAEKSGKGENAVDPVLPEKKRARRRLIGAIALVLAAVIGLPMLLDSEPKPVAGDISIEIPSKEKSASVSRMPQASPGSGVPTAASLDAKEEVVAPAPAMNAPDSARQEKSAAKVAPKDHEKPATAVSPVTDAPRITAEKARPAETHPEPAPKAESKASSNPDETARALALLNGRPDPKPDSRQDRKSSTKFVIQVAALATKEKVDELRARLKDAGISSYTQKVATASGDRTRIRVGPFSTKEDAEKMRAKIVKLGLNGTLLPA